VPSWNVAYLPEFVVVVACRCCWSLSTPLDVSGACGMVVLFGFSERGLGSELLVIL
jgi:hypothetical protein